MLAFCPEKTAEPEMFVTSSGDRTKPCDARPERLIHHLEGIPERVSGSSVPARRSVASQRKEIRTVLNQRKSE